MKKLKEFIVEFAQTPMHLHIKKGGFHHWLGKSEDEPITGADIQRGLAAGGHAAKMANFAKNSRKWHHEEAELSTEAHRMLTYREIENEYLKPVKKKADEYTAPSVDNDDNASNRGDNARLKTNKSRDKKKNILKAKTQSENYQLVDDATGYIVEVDSGSHPLQEPTHINLKQFVAPDNMTAVFHNIPNTAEHRQAIKDWQKQNGIPSLWIRGRGPRERGNSHAYGVPGRSVGLGRGLDVHAKKTVAAGPHSHHIPLDKATHFGVYERNKKGNILGMQWGLENGRWGPLAGTSTSRAKQIASGMKEEINLEESSINPHVVHVVTRHHPGGNVEVISVYRRKSNAKQHKNYTHEDGGVVRHEIHTVRYHSED